MTVTVLAGSVWVTVGVGCVVVTVTVVGRVAVSTGTEGCCEVSVAGGVVVVRVVTERVAAVGIVLVPTAELLPPPPHDESTKPPNAIRMHAVASLTGRAPRHALLPQANNLAIIHAAPDALGSPQRPRERDSERQGSFPLPRGNASRSYEETRLGAGFLYRVS